MQTSAGARKVSQAIRNSLTTGAASTIAATAAIIVQIRRSSRRSANASMAASRLVEASRLDGYQPGIAARLMVVRVRGLDDLPVCPNGEPVEEQRRDLNARFAPIFRETGAVCAAGKSCAWHHSDVR